MSQQGMLYNLIRLYPGLKRVQHVDTGIMYEIEHIGVGAVFVSLYNTSSKEITIVKSKEVGPYKLIEAEIIQLPRTRRR